MKWRSEVLHHERRFERALEVQMIERSPDDVPSTARQQRVHALPWELNVSRAHALLSLNDAAQHRADLRGVVYSDLDTWLIVARACTAVVDAMTLRVCCVA